MADGTGADLVAADVAVADGRVVAVGPDLTGDEVLDASGSVVAPGFIDLHTHYDPQVTWDPWLTPSSSLGVTSVVAGNCGFSLAPCRPELRGLMMRTLEAVEDISYAAMAEAIPWSFATHPEYLAAVADAGPGLNFGGYVGHTAVRLWVMGEDAYERTATDDEIDQMAAVVRQAVAGGAVGFSTDRAGFLQGADGRPVPSVVASWEETQRLCLAVAEAGRGIVHVAPGNVLANVEWIYDFAPRFGRTITWSAILAFPEGSGQIDWRQKLGVHRAHPGADVHPQVTSRVLTFEWGLENPLTLYRYPSFGDLGRSDAPARRSSFADPAWRARARAEMEAGIPTDWRRMRIVASDQPGVAGRTLDRLAAERGGHPLDVLLDVGLADDLATRVEVEAANVDEAAVAELLTAPGCLLGLSDAGAHVGQLCDAVLPLHFLAEWVRDRDLLPVAEGLRKTSAEIADVLGLADRGYLRPGARADLVVLDWEDLSPGPATRVRDLPGGGERLVADSPGGLRHVLVNGRPIRREGEPCRPERRPGQLLGPKRYP